MSIEVTVIPLLFITNEVVSFFFFLLDYLFTYGSAADSVTGSMKIFSQSFVKLSSSVRVGSISGCMSISSPSVLCSVFKMPSSMLQSLTKGGDFMWSISFKVPSAFNLLSEPPNVLTLLKLAFFLLEKCCDEPTILEWPNTFMPMPWRAGKAYSLLYDFTRASGFYSVLIDFVACFLDFGKVIDSSRDSMYICP